MNHWWNFYCDRWDSSGLRKLLVEHKSDQLLVRLIKLQMSSITLLLCIKRIYPNVPAEIVDTIRDFTPDHVNYFRPEKYTMKQDIKLECDDYNIDLKRLFNHCRGRKNKLLYYLKKKDIIELKKYLIIGRIGIAGDFYGRIKYVIVDVNYDYGTIRFLTDDSNVIFKEGLVRMMTFNEFITFDDDGSCTYRHRLSEHHMLRGLIYEVEKRF